MANTAGPFGKRGREDEPSTARILGAYRRELRDEGFDPEEIRTLSIEAARQLLRDEPLVVGSEIPEGMTLLHVAIPVNESLVKDKRAVERVASEAALRAVERVLSDGPIVDALGKLTEIPSPDEMRRYMDGGERA